MESPEDLLKQSSLSKLEVRQTNYGQGLFTQHYYSPSIIIAEVTGSLIDDPSYSSDYCVDMGGSFSLEIEPPFRYLNHSCEPNCALIVLEEDEDRIPTCEEEVANLYLETIREIEADAQLTIDYGWPADAAIECLCGSSNCRGWVVDEEEIDNLLPENNLDCEMPSSIRQYDN
ncbi:MAG: SET domain-containing protein-lysine N-methyltransferase [Pirellulales bacterium]